MKLPRITLAAIGCTVLVLAVDLAILRSALLGRSIEHPAVFALFLMPILDAFMVCLFRLRRPGRRTAGRVYFLAAGSVATAFLFASCVVAPWAAMAAMQAVGRPIATAIMGGMRRIFGGAMGGQAMQVVLAIGLDVLLPIALFCGPPLAVAFGAGWVARRRSRPAVGTIGPRPDPAVTAEPVVRLAA